MKEPTAQPHKLRPEAFDTEGEYRSPEELQAKYSPGMKEFGDALIKRGLSLKGGSGGYAGNKALPDDIRSLPQRYQTVYRIAYNNALAAGRSLKQAADAATAAMRTLEEAES